jgi:hypothetical protein
MRKLTEKVDAGESHALGIESYDPVSKEFITNWYQSDGSRYSGRLTITGNTVVWTGPLDVGGKTLSVQGDIRMQPDS